MSIKPNVVHTPEQRAVLKPILQGMAEILKQWPQLSDEQRLNALGKLYLINNISTKEPK